MKITKTPNTLTPISKGLIFAFDTEQSEPRNVLVEIINHLTDEVVATQQLCGVTQGEVDIAPYVEHFTFRRPSSYTSTTMIDEGYRAIYKIRIDDTVSPIVVVSTNNVAISAPQILSDMPLRRTICEGESDEVLLFAPLGSNVMVKVFAGNEELASFTQGSHYGVVRFTLVPADFYNEENLRVVFHCDNQIVGELHYNIIVSSRADVRLAWVGDKGAIERYTFPYSRKVRREVERKRIERESLPRTIGVATRYNLHLASRYERAATIKALQQIISSPRVWIDLGEDFQRVEVLNSNLEQGLQGKPDCVELELCLWRREVAQC